MGIRQKLPKDVQNFNKLRTENFLYVDKTKYLHKLINEGFSYFLSRPRRFGKSLLISTLEELFKGNKKLFKDLYIYDKWDWENKHPVLKIDFSNRSYRTNKNLEKSLNYFLDKSAKEHGISLIAELTSDKFEELIEKIHEKYDKKLVVLVDEYDKPIIDNISKNNVLEENKTTLHDFYQILKGQDEHLQFVFLTGVSKFAGTSIFSGLNSTTDITLHEDYSTICGYSEEELKENFFHFIEELSIKENESFDETLRAIKEFYNGYSWDGENFLYNPYSTILVFYFREFSNNWFDSGTPTFLIKLLKDKNDLDSVFNQTEISSHISISFETINNINTNLLMFQTGYLTVKKKEKFDRRISYKLAIPNEEVRESISEYLLNAYTAYPLDNMEQLRLKMRKNILNKDGKAFELNIRELMANIPYQLKDSKDESY